MRLPCVVRRSLTSANRSCDFCRSPVGSVCLPIPVRVSSLLCTSMQTVLIRIATTPSTHQLLKRDKRKTVWKAFVERAKPSKMLSQTTDQAKPRTINYFPHLDEVERYLVPQGIQPASRDFYINLRATRHDVCFLVQRKNATYIGNVTCSSVGGKTPWHDSGTAAQAGPTYGSKSRHVSTHTCTKRCPTANPLRILAGLTLA